MSLRFKVGDRVRAIRLLDHVIEPKTRGLVLAAYPHSHSSYPYDVLFDGDQASFPASDSELEYSRWYRRFWHWLKESTKPRDAEEHFGNEETVRAAKEVMLLIDTIPPRSMVDVPVKLHNPVE